jgi:outer membrane biosynthesis protein TonB
MVLHRDIFWVGKQWAVTGYGMQAVDQKQKSKFDIEASRLWEDDLTENLSDQRWFNADDFSAGLSVARARYPEPPGKAASRKKAAAKASAPATPPKSAPKAESKPEPKAEPTKADAKPKTAKSQPAAEPAKPAPKIEPAKSQVAPAAPSKPPLKADPAKPMSKAERNKRAPAQFNMQIGRWPAKFTQMWRVRIKRK